MKSEFLHLQEIIERAWENRALLDDSTTREAIRAVVEAVDKGELRCAEPIDLEQSKWQVNEWVKKAIILYFPIQKMRTMRAGELEWYDKMELKRDYHQLGVRVVPHGVARYGAYIAPGAVMMPSYVNIGAYVDSGTMVDTWATVGSCARSVRMSTSRVAWVSVACWSPFRPLRSSSRTTASSARVPSLSRVRTSVARRCSARMW